MCGYHALRSGRVNPVSSQTLPVLERLSLEWIHIHIFPSIKLNAFLSAIRKEIRTKANREEIFSYAVFCGPSSRRCVAVVSSSGPNIIYALVQPM